MTTFRTFFSRVVVTRPTCFRRDVLAPVTMRLPRTTHRKTWSEEPQPINPEGHLFEDGANNDDTTSTSNRNPQRFRLPVTLETSALVGSQILHLYPEAKGSVPKPKASKKYTSTTPRRSTILLEPSRNL